MKNMTRLERFNAAVRGEQVDRLPASVWLHLASEHLPGKKVAELHTEYAKAYGWDYLKVMNDYRYPLPGLTEVQRESDLQRFSPVGMTEQAFHEQLTCLKALREMVGPDMPLIETLFNPLQTLVRTTGVNVMQLVFAHPEAGHNALDAITETLIEYIRRLQALGVNGIFYSINGAVEPEKGGLTDAQFAEFVAPYDERILKAAEGMIRVAHIHGFHLRFDRVVNLPVEVFSWSHLNSAPALADARKMTSAAFMGGINETHIAHQAVSEVAHDIRKSVAEAGARKFIIGPGCTVPPDTPAKLLRSIGDVARQIKI
jgi:uroporphyrinogen decarboxylase